jgi:hypothetical protein
MPALARATRRNRVTVASAIKTDINMVVVQTLSTPVRSSASATAATQNPRKPPPTSPMKMRAGGQFQHTKPAHAPDVTASSDRNGVSTRGEA